MRALLATLSALVILGGCTPVVQPPQPPFPVQNAIDRVEGEFLVAERLWDRPERTLAAGESAKITLRVTAKTKLEYIYWREVLHIGIAFLRTDEITTTSDLEFMVLQVPAGGTMEWTYTLEGRGIGQDMIEGQIKSVVGSLDESLTLKTTVLVR